jgi:hypothetical protein
MLARRLVTVARSSATSPGIRLHEDEGERERDRDRERERYYYYYYYYCDWV